MNRLLPLLIQLFHVCTNEAVLSLIGKEWVCVCHVICYQKVLHIDLFQVDGKEVPGPLFDFGLLMYHCAVHLVAKESGPFFYLSKLEGANEARLWNEIFCWAQEKLSIPHGMLLSFLYLHCVNVYKMC